MITTEWDKDKCFYYCLLCDVVQSFTLHSSDMSSFNLLHLSTIVYASRFNFRFWLDHFSLMITVEWHKDKWFLSVFFFTAQRTWGYFLLCNVVQSNTFDKQPVRQDVEELKKPSLNSSKSNLKVVLIHFNFHKVSMNCGSPVVTVKQSFIFAFRMKECCFYLKPLTAV